MLSSCKEQVLSVLGKRNSSPSERGEPLILCHEGIIPVASLHVQGIAGHAIFNCDRVFTLIFSVMHFSWFFVLPQGEDSALAIPSPGQQPAAQAGVGTGVSGGEDQSTWAPPPGDRASVPFHVLQKAKAVDSL